MNNVRVAVGPAQTIASQANLMDCCCSRRTRCLPRPKPWITCSPISKRRPDCGIRRQTLELATRQTTESAPPAAHSNLAASIERPSGCSSLATLRRSNRQTSYGRTHGGIAISGLGLPGMTRKILLAMSSMPGFNGPHVRAGSQRSSHVVQKRPQWSRPRTCDCHLLIPTQHRPQRRRSRDPI